MNQQDLNNKLIAILGYGLEGKAVYNYLQRHGHQPVIFDHKAWENFSEADKTYIREKNINVVLGPDSFLELKGFDVIFRSPGIRLAQVLPHLSKQAVITSQTKWFFSLTPAKIIGVTGTKGKGTTSALIYKILEHSLSSSSADKSAVYLTGNIGLVQPLDILDNLKPNDLVVYELSSFQLQDLEQSPHIGVTLMVTSEHLDYHLNTEDYVKSKEAICKFQNSADVSIYNVDYPNSAKIGEQGSGKKIFISTHKKIAPGAYISDDRLVAVDDHGREENVIQINALPLRGRHNLENICAAYCAVRAAGATNEAFVKTVQEFKGLEHRLEFVGEKRGVKYYNDSFSTTPETAIAAIKSFSEPLIIILGGSSKKADFSELGKVVAGTPNLKAAILIGSEGERIKAEILKNKNFAGQLLEGAQNMQEIFEQAVSVAASGDCVVLSPACASFGMFENYKDRGQQFKSKFEELK